MKWYAIMAATMLPLMLASIPAAAAEIGVDIHFSANETSIIRAYFTRHLTRRKHGKPSKRGLPPGIAKNLGRGKPLPPGIAKNFLPGELVGRLPPVHKGYERVIVGGKVLLVEIATQVIHDILTDVIVH